MGFSQGINNCGLLTVRKRLKINALVFFYEFSSFFINIALNLQAMNFLLKFRNL
jgi:hypothetical protein